MLERDSQHSNFVVAPATERIQLMETELPKIKPVVELGLYYGGDWTFQGQPQGAASRLSPYPRWAVPSAALGYLAWAFVF